jgi:flagellar hook-basal body complex protein FliE
MTDIRFSQAAGAYKDALRAAEDIIQKVSASSSQSTSETASVADSGFFGMVESSLKSAANTGYNSEKISTLGLSGKAGIADVVNAVNAAEVSLKTVVALRDKMIGAYQDIIKMQI